MKKMNINNIDRVIGKALRNKVKAREQARAKRDMELLFKANLKKFRNEPAKVLA
jgi:hypothetical protein